VTVRLSLPWQSSDHAPAWQSSDHAPAWQSSGHAPAWQSSDHTPAWRDATDRPSLVRAWSPWLAARRLGGMAPVVLLGLTRVLLAAAWPASAHERAARVRDATRHVAAWLLRGFGVRVQRVGRRPDGRALYAANHLSWLDILVALVVLPETAVIAKREVGTWPLIGAIARAGDTILIDRSRRRDVLPVIRTMRAHFAADRAVLLFAEGTTSDGARVLPFRSALFDAAVCEGVPVVPVTLQPDTGRGGPSVRDHVCWWGDAALLPAIVRLAGVPRTRVVVRFGTPVSAVALPRPPLEARILRQQRRTARRALSHHAQRDVSRRFRAVD
jgi:1-acyl-sn-glycerol-3-phosphate acyltransferase